MSKAIGDHCVHSIRVSCVPFVFGIDALFLNKHLGTHGLGFFFQSTPVTCFQGSDCLSFFEAQHGFAQHLWHRHRGFGVGIGVHIEQLTGDQQLIATKYSAYKLDRRIADALTTQAHI